MYFGRGLHDESNKGEAQQRLQQFSGASAISSNAYFGREEDEYNNARAAELEEGLLGVENLSDLERSAKDIARRVMNEAGFDDFSEVQSAVRQGALRVSSFSASKISVAVDRVDLPIRCLTFAAWKLPKRLVSSIRLSKKCKTLPAFPDTHWVSLHIPVSVLSFT